MKSQKDVPVRRVDATVSMNARVSRGVRRAAVVLGCALAAGVAVAGLTVNLDKTPYKDQRTSRAGTGAGYAGNMSDDGANAGTGRDLFVKYFIEQPDECWKILKAGGCHVCREWSANDRWQERIAPFKAKDDKERAAVKKRIGYDTSHDWNKIAYDFRKKHGIRTLLTLENYSVCTNYITGARSEAIADVKRVILEYVQWIVDNGYKDQVIGFELGNEPYFGSDPENFAERWAEIVPGIKRIFPEVDIGFTCAEYREGDPDIDAVRRRSTAVDKWFEGGSYFGFQKVNQWTGRFIVAFTNGLKYCNHVIYHFYGGDVADGMGPCGFGRIRHFAKAFPEIADRRVWITEYRERSDEDCRCEQMFSSTLTKAHYVLATTAAPMFDCTSIHQISALSGGFCVADGKGEWIVQWDPAGRNFTDPDFTGRPRIEVGPAGPMYKLYNEALLGHPIIVEHGQWDVPRDPEKLWAGVLYYGYTHNLENWHMGGEKGPRPKANGAAQWVLAANPDRTSVAILVCNSSEDTWTPHLDLPGYRITGKAHVRTFSCPPEKQQLHQIPGEPRPTWEEEYDVAASDVSIRGTTIATVTFPVERARLQVGVLTDTHVRADTNSTVALRKAFELFARQRADAIVHLGDLADTHDAKAYANYVAARAAVFTNGCPREAFAFAFHDVVNTPAAADWSRAETVWRDVSARLGVKQELYDIFTLKDYVFAVAPEWPDRARYEKLVTDAVAKAGAGRPVFLLQHRPPYGTTAKSTAFGCPDTFVRDDLKTLTRAFLDRFPNLVVLSGHVHTDLRDARDIWQGTFTAVSAGGLAPYGEPLAGNPENGAANASVLVLSVFADEIAFTRYDLETGAPIGATWKVPLPFDAATAPYREAVMTNRCDTGYFGQNNNTLVVARDETGALAVTFPEAAARGAENTTYRYRVDLDAQLKASVDAERDASFTGEAAPPRVFTPVSRLEVMGSWNHPQTIAAWMRNPHPRTARFSGALLPPGARLRVTVSPESFAGTFGASLVWEGFAPAYVPPKPAKNEKPKVVKVLRYEDVWTGAPTAEPVKDWPGGRRFAVPATAWAGASGTVFRVSFAFAADRAKAGDATAAESRVRFDVQDAQGRNQKGGFWLPGLGVDAPRRYATTVVKPSADATFSFRLSHALVEAYAISDVKIERVK